MPNSSQYAPREQGILFRAFQNAEMGPKYQNMDVPQRLGLLQDAMKAGEQPSLQDMELLKRLRQMQEVEMRAPQAASPPQGLLQRMFGGAQDPLGALKNQDYR